MKFSAIFAAATVVLVCMACQNPAIQNASNGEASRAVGPVGKSITLKANANGSYVSADQNLANTQLVANRAAPSGWETFTVVDAGNNLVALKASNGKYVSANLNPATVPLMANGPAIGTWEQFQWIEVAGSQVQLKANINGQFVCADLNVAANLVANRAAASGWETFTYAIAGSVPTPTPSPSVTPSVAPSAVPGWRLVWSDEFDGTGSVDANKWIFDLGGGGWGNAEQETYTNSTNNVYRDGNSNLVIKAINSNGAITSGRIRSAGKFEFTYGKVEMRAKLPYCQGIWPAFWMLGSVGGGWPNNGEIDIMENIGKAAEQNKVYGTIHGPGYSGAGGIGAAYTGPRFADGFHTFGIEWETNVIRWYVDGNLYETRTPADLNGNTWVFNHNFYLLLNLAVGGQWPGNYDASTVFPQSYTIDYVRVYQR